MPCRFGLAQARVPAKSWSVRTDLLDRLELARLEIERRLDETIPSRELAETACMSVFHFIRLFRSTFGASPAQYRARRRLEAAEELLVLGHPVGWVAAAVGRTSTASFARDFHAHRGQSPKTFRNLGKERRGSAQEQ